MTNQAMMTAARREHERFAKGLESDLRRGLKHPHRESPSLAQKIAWTQQDGRLVLSWRF